MSCVKMKFRKPGRWRRSEKSSRPTSTLPNPVGTLPQRSQPIKDEEVRQALENVRNLSATTGEEFALTILDRDAELVGWMNFSRYRMPSIASSERRNAMADGFGDRRSAEVAVLEEGDRGSIPRSATSDSTMTSSTSATVKFGKSGIEISGEIHMQGPRAHVHFGEIDWNPPTALRLGEGDGVGPAEETANMDS